MKLKIYTVIFLFSWKFIDLIEHKLYNFPKTLLHVFAFWFSVALCGF